MKQCTSCQGQFPITDFRVNTSLNSARTSNCKSCITAKRKARHLAISQDPVAAAAERERDRARPRRTKTKEQTAATIAAYHQKFPEKALAIVVAGSMAAPLGMEKHHWSYCAEHNTDIIFLSRADHRRLHRYLVYDQGCQKYRRSTDLVLLDTRKQHQQFIALVSRLP